MKIKIIIIYWSLVFFFAGFFYWHAAPKLIIYRMEQYITLQSCSVTPVLHYEYMIPTTWEGDEAAQFNY